MFILFFLVIGIMASSYCYSSNNQNFGEQELELCLQQLIQAGSTPDEIALLMRDAGVQEAFLEVWAEKAIEATIVLGGALVGSIILSGVFCYFSIRLCECYGAGRFDNFFESCKRYCNICWRGHDYEPVPAEDLEV
ncbi:hypothetical protein K2W90_04200 [Candidatus Babeliales bacterium]|nr:hypothetical protein [Candidatus Babeliales bacterium]